METRELLKKVRKIEIKTRRLSDHLFSGAYHSSFKGKGMSFSEVREYTFGDDVRAIDWNVTARFHKPFVKVFEEERELTMMLMVDISGSENIGSRQELKREMITEICATLVFSATKNDDKVGMIMFSDQVELYVPPKKGKSHILRIIRELINYEGKSNRTSLSTGLEFLAGVMKKKAIVFILSDFMDKGYEKPLRIVARKHDLTTIRIHDPLEEKLPNVGVVQVQDTETGQVGFINTSSSRVRSAYRKNYMSYIQYFHNIVKKISAGMIEIETGTSYVKKLLVYFKQRS